MIFALVSKCEIFANLRLKLWFVWCCVLCPRCWPVVVLCYLVWRGIDGSLAQSVTRYQKRKLLHKTQDILTIKPSADTRLCSKYSTFAGPQSLYSNSEATSVSPWCCVRLAVRWRLRYQNISCACCQCRARPAASSEAAAGAGRGGPPRSTQPQAELSKGLLRLKPTQAFGGISLILEEQG